jgi:uracil-DNA glycosylase
MANYKQYKDLGSFQKIVWNGVREEWMTNQKFVDEANRALTAIFDISRYATANFCPGAENIFNMLKLLRPSDVKVVCVAQDPYPNLRDAVGIAFHSPAKYCPKSASRINSNMIAHGLLDQKFASNSDYMSYVRQGMFLWNRTLTTIEGESSSHTSLWGSTTTMLLSSIPSKSVALLFGNDAKALISVLSCKMRVEHIHPAARVGNGVFEKADVFGKINACLKELNLSPIDWSLRGSSSSSSSSSH